MLLCYLYIRFFTIVFFRRTCCGVYRLWRHLYRERPDQLVRFGRRRDGRDDRTTAWRPDVGHRRGSPVPADGSSDADSGKWRGNGCPRYRVVQVTLQQVAKSAYSQLQCFRTHRCAALATDRSNHCTLLQFVSALAVTPVTVIVRGTPPPMPSKLSRWLHFAYLTLCRY